MIRDPSDGTVKEKPKVESALPNSSLASERVDAAEMAKLERAREWLADWHRKKLEGSK